jgi:muramidase (phage lysozyme)
MANETPLDNPNVQKFLDFIGKAEGADYNVIVGGKRFDDFSKHPGIVGLRTKEGPSTAAGKYQITKTTYDDFAPKLGITDFSPESQDRIAVEIFKREKALGDIQKGDFEAAINKLGGRFASLPSSK